MSVPTQPATAHAKPHESAEGAPNLPTFTAPFAPPDEPLVAALFARAALPAATEAAIDAQATRWIGAIRAQAGGLGGIEDFLREYSLSTKEGLALMVLAEALLRVPDAATADRLIEDKLGQGDFAQHETKSQALLVSASAWALGITARVIQPGETPDTIVGQLVKRLGLPALRGATRQAMRLMGSHFVLGQTIEEALRRAASGAGRLFRYSFDMLGEGARTAKAADEYFASYARAIEAIGASAGNRPLPDRPGISVKLSALHPRYEAISRRRVLRELVPRVVELARAARGHDLNFTIDAEEADRLELSLEIFGAVAADRGLSSWDRFGLAVQAYQKRAGAVIDHVDEVARALGRRFMLRLVKGAYWDTEIKRAQERGLPDYPVFTRKAATDLNYLGCAARLLEARPRLYPQFATHNALTIASIVARAPDLAGYEFQRLHGMGDDVFRALLAERPQAACRTYAPVGGHRDLLAYLVRRLLENGANTSFVSAAADPAVPVQDLLRRPQALLGSPDAARHPRISLPRDLFAPSRRNSTGVEFGERAGLHNLLESVSKVPRGDWRAAPLIGGQARKGAGRVARSPIDDASVGTLIDSAPADVEAALAAASAGWRSWDRTPVAARARTLEQMADLLETHQAELLALLQTEAGKTLDDALSELREAVDFCRYYAAEALRHFARPKALPAPTGEENSLAWRGRGVFVCISPWNFPLAIFIGQIAAALVAGNSVIAKPAEQTGLVAFAAIRLFLDAGIPANALHLLPGGGTVGAALVGDKRIAGVAFTGSTATAWKINRALAARNAPIAPLIAETGGVNVMIVDATALPEQVCDDVLISAFRSTGQRCSALRLLCLQQDVADKMLDMIAGAAAELKLGDPRDIDVQIGPVIDAAALARLNAHVEAMKRTAHVRFAGALPAEVAAHGHFIAPHIFEVSGVDAVPQEVFGPILHVCRYPARDFDALLDSIDALGFGLTLGVQSRIDATVEHVVARLGAGNVYINRNIIGAVVGVQPFGGNGLSGTGPKAGGPDYLKRFASEQVVSVNSAAAGGNASLMTLKD